MGAEKQRRSSLTLEAKMEKVNISTWVEWTSQNRVQPELVAFITWRPILLPKLLEAGLPEDLEFSTLRESLGNDFAVEFVWFLKVFRNLTDPKLALKNPEKVKIPTDLAELYALSNILASLVSQETMPNFVALIGRMPPEFGVLAMRLARVNDASITDTPSFRKWIEGNSDVLL